MKYRPLGSTGLTVSALSFGASSLGGVFRDIDESEAIRAVHVSLDLGINFIDVSPYYGATRAESVLGRALREISRDRYHLATKVGQYGEGEFDFSAGRVTRSVEESMARLGVDFIDLIQCHDIEFADLRQIREETLPALHLLKRQGKVGHIGITGLPLKVFPAVIDSVEPGMVETILSFCRYELNDTALAGLLPYCEARQVGVINASPTGMGLLTPRGAPAWHPASEAIKTGCRQAVAYCEERGMDVVELAVQFSISDPRIATTLVGSASPENMARNIGYASREPDREKLEVVRAILAPIKDFNFTRGREENRDAIVS